MEMGEFLALHTPRHAERLRRLLEGHGIACEIIPYGGASGSAPELVSVCVDKSQLPLAVSLVESGHGESSVKIVKEIAGMGNMLLIPVDFSEMSLLAVKAGFQLARRLSLSPLLLHSYVRPLPVSLLPQDDPLAGETAVEDAREDVMLMKDAGRRMSEFSERIRAMRSEGAVDDVEFSTRVVEGIPDEAITQFCRECSPSLVVMATRGKSKREKEMVGSVTAEVLDSCRVPVFTVPENYSFCGVENITRLAVFCNLDRNDVDSVDALMRMFGYPRVEVWLIPAADRLQDKDVARLEALRAYFVSNYPAARFHDVCVACGSLREHCESLFEKEQIQLIIVPNKKKNIFTRLFNPGIAHRILFEKDMPMLVLPV